MKSAIYLLRFALPAVLILAATGAYAQATMTTSGNWNLATNWAGSNIGDDLSEDITINNSVSPTIPTGLNYTVGNVTLNQDNVFTVDAASTLNVGSSGNPRNFTTNLNPILVINGAVEIWGDFIANNNVIFNITGTVHVHGSMLFSGAGTNFTVNGTGDLIVDGDMTGAGNVNFTVNGQVEVFGSVDVGAGSNLTGTGTFTLHGSCSGTPFCSSGTLPVELLYFKAKPTTTSVDLAWATASEFDVDYFMLERSLDGKKFHEIGRVSGMGNSTSERIYSFTDEKPAPGISFFQLAEVSRGGEKRILSTIKINFDGSKNLTIHPNPAVNTDQILLSLNFHSSEKHQISVYDIRGTFIGNAEMDGSESTLPISLASGVYILKVTSKEFSSIQKLIVQ